LEYEPPILKTATTFYHEERNYLSRMILTLIRVYFPTHHSKTIPYNKKTVEAIMPSLYKI